jgi:hypothetical protein
MIGMATRWRLAGLVGRIGRPGAWVCLAALLLGGLVRLWMITHTQVISEDGTAYIRMAQRLGHAPFQTMREFPFHPGYPALVAALDGLLSAAGVPGGVARWDMSGQLVSLSSALAATVALYLLGRRVFGWHVGAVAVLMFTVTRKWSILGADVVTDALSVALQAWACLCILPLRARLETAAAPRWPLAAMAGLLVGAGYLVRPEAGLLLPVALGVWLWNWRRGSGGIGPVLVAAAAAFAVFALVTGPYMAVIGAVTPKSRLIESVWSRLFVSAGTSVLDVGYSLPRQMVNKFAEAQHPLLACLTALYLLGYSAARIRRFQSLRLVLPMPRADGACLVFLYTLLWLPLLAGRYGGRATDMSYRYLLFPALLLVPAAAGGLVGLVRLIGPLVARKGSPPRPAVQEATALLVAGLMAIALAAHALRPIHPGKEHFRQAGDFLATLAGPGDLILADDPRVLHYSGREGMNWLAYCRDVMDRPLPGQADLLGLLRRSGARFLAVTDSHAGGELANRLSRQGLAWGIFAFHTPPTDRLVAVGHFLGVQGVELLWRKADKTLSVWRYAIPAGGRAEIVSLPGRLGGEEDLLGAGDCDGDGLDELLWQNGPGGGITVRRADGATVGGPLPSPPEGPWRLEGAGDIDGDGRDDLLWRRAADGAIRLALSAEGAVPTTPLQPVNLSWDFVGIGDLNGDAWADLLWRGRPGGMLQAWTMQQDRRLGGLAVAERTPADWQPVGLYDFDGDGHRDLLWRRDGDGKLACWYMAGGVPRRSLQQVAVFSRDRDCIRVYRVLADPPFGGLDDSTGEEAP